MKDKVYVHLKELTEPVEEFRVRDDRSTTGNAVFALIALGLEYSRMTTRPVVSLPPPDSGPEMPS